MQAARQWQFVLFAGLIGLGVDLTIAGLLNHYTAEPWNRGWDVILLIFAGLYAIGIVAWFRRNIKAWIIHLAGKAFRERTARQVAEAWGKRGLPVPERYEFNGDNYLTRLAEDESLAANVRVAAAMELAMLRYPWQNGHYIEAWRLATIADDAVREMKSADL